MRHRPPIRKHCHTIPTILVYMSIVSMHREGQKSNFATNCFKIAFVYILVQSLKISMGLAHVGDVLNGPTYVLYSLQYVWGTKASRTATVGAIGIWFICLFYSDHAKKNLIHLPRQDSQSEGRLPGKDRGELSYCAASKWRLPQSASWSGAL